MDSVYSLKHTINKVSVSILAVVFRSALRMAWAGGLEKIQKSRIFLQVVSEDNIWLSFHIKKW